MTRAKRVATGAAPILTHRPERPLNFLLFRARDAHHFIEKDAVSRQRVPRVNRPLPVPVGESSPGLFEDGEKGRAIPDGHYGVEHDFGAARRDQRVSVAIAPSAPRARAPLKLR